MERFDATERVVSGEGWATERFMQLLAGWVQDLQGKELNLMGNRFFTRNDPEKLLQVVKGRLVATKM